MRCPSGWKVTIASEYCTSVRDGTHDSPKFVEHGYPLITSKNIKGGAIDTNNASLISAADFEEINRRSKVAQWDVLYSMIGTVGEVSLVKEEQINFAIKNIGLFKCSNEDDGRWLSFWLRSPQSKGYVTERLRGTSQQYISLGELRNLPVFEPSDKEQRSRILAILQSYEDLIENNQRSIALLEESARLLYREWFVNLRFPGCDSITVKDGIPEGWTRPTLGSICDQIKEPADPAHVAPDTPYLSMEHMTPKSIALGVWETAGKVTSSKLHFQKNDVLFGRIRPYFHKVGVAMIDGITSTDMIVSRAKSKTLLPLVALVMSSDEFVAHAVTTSNGTKMPRADWKILKNWDVSVPGENDLEVFSNQVKPIFEAIEVLSKQNRALAEARNQLLPKLMSGEIQV